MSNNQRLEQVVEFLKDGNYAEAQDLINQELDEKADTVRSAVTSAVTSNIFESNNSKNVKGIGRVVVKPTGAYLENVTNYDEALKKSAMFAEFVNGSSGKYTVEGSGGKEMTVKVNGKKSFDMFFDENDSTLNFEGDFSKSDIERFRKTGRLDEASLNEATITFDIKEFKPKELIEFISDIELNTGAVAKSIKGTKVTYDKKDKSTVIDVFKIMDMEEDEDYVITKG